MKSMGTMVLFLSISLPGSVLACGGFFCNATPVDQQAERIIFVQDDDDTITSYVEIAYQGDPEGFAWIVPVPSVPELDTWLGGSFNALDLATQPRWNFQNDCFLAEADGGPQAAGGGGDDGGVMVLDQQRVGPFDTVTLQSDDPRQLVEWLRVNEYRVVPAMEPFIALYTAEGMKFLAMKLAPGEGTESIQPIKMTYEAAAPAVPLRLTAVAAQLEMGVKIWVLGDGRYGPRNVPDITVGDTEVVFDPNRWENNYLPLVARKIDGAGGHGFVTEMASPTAPLAAMIRDSFVPERLGQSAIDARDALVALLESKPYITRLYSRVSPEEMDIDPIFHGVQGGDVSNIHNIPAPEGQEDICGRGQEDGPPPCEFLACGAAGVCAEAAEASNGHRAGCACAPGAVARAGFSPDGRAMVSCGDVRLNFASTGGDTGSLQFPNICDGATFCGQEGECVMLNGFPACRCNTGHVSIPALDEQGMWTATCVAAKTPDSIDFSSTTIREPNLPYPGRITPMEPMPTDQTPTDGNTMSPENRPGGLVTAGKSDSGCAATDNPTTPLWTLLGLLFLGMRRRRG
jgi:uncharacterized protein (TIGR03382 family)